MSWFRSDWQQRTTWLLYCPSPWWGGEDNEKKKAKPFGMGEEQFNRTAKEANSNYSNIDKKIVQNQGNTQSSSLSPPNARGTPEQQLTSPGRLPHCECSMMSHGIEYPICLTSLGQPSRLCPLLASCEN